MRNNMQEHGKNMPPEERADRRREMHEHFEKMSPEERKQFRQDLHKMGGMPPPGAAEK